MKKHLFPVYLMMMLFCAAAFAQEQNQKRRAEAKTRSFASLSMGVQTQFGAERFPRLCLGLGYYNSREMAFAQLGYNRWHPVGQIVIGYGRRVKGPWDFDFYIGPEFGVIDYSRRAGLDYEEEIFMDEKEEDTGALPFLAGAVLRIDSPRLANGVAYFSIDLFLDRVVLEGLAPRWEPGVRIHGVVALVKSPARVRPR